MQLEFFGSKDFDDGKQVFWFEFVEAKPFSAENKMEELVQKLVQLKVESFAIKQLVSVYDDGDLF